MTKEEMEKKIFKQRKLKTMKDEEKERSKTK